MQSHFESLVVSDYKPFFDALMRAASDEVYLIDAETLQMECVSESVLQNTGLNLSKLKQHTLLNVLGVSQQTFKTYLNDYLDHEHYVLLRQELTPSIPHVNYDQMRAVLITLHERQFVLIIRNNTSVVSADDCNQCKETFEKALSESESRADAIVTNAPGLVFQLQFDSNGNIHFVYLSEACKALLGVAADELKKNSRLFYEMMNARDRATLRKRLELSALNLSQLDWEGRVWINDWQDNKWINLRAVPRVLTDGAIQWVGIMINITQSKNEKHEIEESRRELAELTAHLNQVKELERMKIAREIHDDLGGNLTAIKMGLTSIIKKLGTGQEVAVDQAKHLESIVDNTFEAVHKISSDLRPNILDLGIYAALEWQAEEFEKQMGVGCHFHCDQTDISVTTDQAIALFRICQESMSNIAKYAKALEVSIHLYIELNDIVMTITDDGVGIKAGDTFKANSFGLRGMQERVAALYGKFSIQQLEPHGTMITVRLPIE